MKINTYISVLILTLILSACSNEDSLFPVDGEKVSMTFRPQLGKDLNSRAIGDATGIDRLQVVVYEGSETLSKTFSILEEWNQVERNGITLNLIKDYSYKILFWADDKDNTAYTMTDEGLISVDYQNYINRGFDKMEEMDAFYGVAEVTVGSQEKVDKGTVTLTRPFAQLNFMDNAEQPVTGTHKATVTFHDIPIQFDPFNGQVTQVIGNDVTFEFTEFINETMEVNGMYCYYVASNYLFAPKMGTTTVSATIHLQQETDSTLTVKTFEFKDENAIILEKNKKTNIIGSLMP